MISWINKLWVYFTNELLTWSLEICLHRGDSNKYLFVHVISCSIAAIKFSFLQLVSCVDSRQVCSLVCHILAKDFIIFKKDCYQVRLPSLSFIHTGFVIQWFYDTWTCLWLKNSITIFFRTFFERVFSGKLSSSTHSGNSSTLTICHLIAFYLS